VINNARELLEAFSRQYTEKLEAISTLGQQLQKACNRIERSWSGSYAGWHGRMYFKDFQVPSIHERFSGEWGGTQGIPQGWEEKESEEVRDKLEALVGLGLSIPSLEEDLNKIRSEAQTLRDELTLSLPDQEAHKLPAKIRSLIAEIEHYDFGETKESYVSKRLPQNSMSRDLEALRQGTLLPAWLYYEGVAVEAQALAENTHAFLDRCSRLLKHLEAHPSYEAVNSPQDIRGLHPAIYGKCHDLFEKGAYSEAVEKGFKVVRDRLRQLTGHETGSDAFGRGKLHIKGAAAPNVEEDFNAGVKFLTMAIDRFRNEKSHTSDAKIDDPTRAYEYLRLSSLAMNLLDQGEIRA
jgi:uncharacterized protein (TIGR02391 family)